MALIFRLVPGNPVKDSFYKGIQKNTMKCNGKF